MLYDFRHTTPNIPFDYLFDLFPVIKPRSFSIASSNKLMPSKIYMYVAYCFVSTRTRRLANLKVDTDINVSSCLCRWFANTSCQCQRQYIAQHFIKPTTFSSEKLQLLVAVVHYRSKLAKPRLGLCSNYLAGLKPGDPVNLWTRTGAFRFPSNNLPLILVGPGTGVAPFRSFLSEKILHEGKDVDLVLFFGCRGQKKDFYFEDEWQEMMKKSSKFRLFTAFSRDQVSPVQSLLISFAWVRSLHLCCDQQEEKVYVQHQILKEEFLLKEFLYLNRGSFFIAGNAKQMPEQVRMRISFYIVI